MKKSRDKKEKFSLWIKLEKSLSRTEVDQSGFSIVVDLIEIDEEGRMARSLTTGRVGDNSVQVRSAGVRGGGAGGT